MYNVELSYSAGSVSEDRQSIMLELYINGKKLKQMSLLPTKDKETWAVKTEKVFLIKGVNTIEFREEEKNSAELNLDYIDVTAAKTEAFQAEYHVMAESDGDYCVAIKYSAGEQYLEKWQDDRIVAFYTNGVKAKDVLLKGTVTWSQWNIAIEKVKLNAGVNVITFRNEQESSNAYIIVDRIYVYGDV